LNQSYRAFGSEQLSVNYIPTSASAVDKEKVRKSGSEDDISHAFLELFEINLIARLAANSCL
jgi:hypothetical protein